MDFSVEFKRIRESLGISQQKMADMIGIPQKTWSNYENGRTRPKMDVLFALAEKGHTIKGVTSSLMEDWSEDQKKEFHRRREIIKTGAFSPDIPVDDFSRMVQAVDDHPPSRPSSQNEEYMTQIMVRDDNTEPIPIDSELDGEVSLFKFSHGKPKAIPAYKADPNALVMLPIYSQRASAGNGQPPTQMAEIEAYMPVIYELLGGSHPRNCGIVRVIGDSMTDMTLYSGDLVIFDRSQIEGDGVYVISMMGDVRVKRLEYRIFEKKIIIRSENQKRYPDPEIISYETAQEMLMIHGKVVSWVHRHPY